MAATYLKQMLTDSVSRAQREAYGRCMRAPDASAPDALTEDEVAFIAARNSFYVATVNQEGWPYVQHRGGPPGFLRVRDEKTLAFADYRGNRQLLSTGHLLASDKVALFLMDYSQRTRLKILGHARMEAPAAHQDLMHTLPGPERNLVERVMVIEVVGYDWNCPQHITPRFTIAEVEQAVAPLHERIAELERELAAERAPRPARTSPPTGRSPSRR